MGIRIGPSIPSDQPAGNHPAMGRHEAVGPIILVQRGSPAEAASELPIACTMDAGVGLVNRFEGERR